MGTPTHHRIDRNRARERLRGLVGLLLIWLPLWAGALTLDDATPTLPLWPATTVLDDPGSRLTLAEAAARPEAFRPPVGPAENLGLRPHAVWLRTPLVVPADARAAWWWRMDFLRCDEVDVALLGEDGRLVQQFGFRMEAPGQAGPTRLLSQRLAVQPGGRYVLVTRLHKRLGVALLVPIQLQQGDALLRSESRQQLLHGLMLGASLCLAAYGLLGFALRREPLFLWFSLFSATTCLTWANYFGHLQQHVWQALGLFADDAILLSKLGTALSGVMFTQQALQLPRRHPRLNRLVLAVAVALGLLMLGFASGLLAADLLMLVTPLGTPLALALLVPVAWQRARRGGRQALWTLAGWLLHAATLLLNGAMHRGLLAWSPLTDGVAAAGALADQICWAGVLGLRASALHQAVIVARLERDRLLHSAQTDALTGLANRRGLGAAVQAGAQAGRQRWTLFLLDLDGFKAVNDAAGHDAGDAVLVEVARRLRAVVRDGDLVCRLGGDEFVVLLADLADDADAQAVGRQLQQITAADFDVGASGLETSPRLGVTIGYAHHDCAPHDDPQALLATLLSRADAAMYAGKRAGKGRVTAAG